MNDFRLFNVLDVVWQAHPGMPGSLIDGHSWRGELGVGERADGYANYLRIVLRVIIYR